VDEKTIIDLSSSFFSLAIAGVGIGVASEMLGIERDELAEIMMEKIEMGKKINMENKNGT